ncbi:MAG: ABC transporter permease [Patescibacteria group bacterium]|nr:ABC transporter permease [Patescibacteria group bacterium]MDE1945947.1 ABC transporter permease [Patescibacteria group bacterium]
MTFSDLSHETASALLANKVRTALTMLGIVIGIASVIAMLAIGTGASASIQSSIQSIGSNLVIVTPAAQRNAGSIVSTGRGTANSLTMDDANAIASDVTSAKAVAPDVTTRGKQVVAGGNNTNTTVIGTVPAYLDVRNFSVNDGSFFTDADVTELSRVAILGPTTASDLFATGTEPVGQTVRIAGNIFTVIGVMKSKGGSGFNNPDDAVYIPITVAQQYLSGNRYVSEISIEAASPDLVTDAQNQATSLLLARHNISDPTQADFSTINQSDILSTASSVTSTLTYLLAAIAGISLLVGGIGIMNMMLTTVTERTKEIGLRKAIGAKKRDIRLQFLFESVAMTTIGGVVGIVLGIGIAFALSLTGAVKAEVTVFPIILSFSVSAIIGIAFGYYPAARASDLNPIDALRYE